MAQVRIDKVTKVYPGGVTAIKDAELTVEDREFVVLVGPSGCGKSTLLRMIAGLETITQGDIHIGDRLINDVPPKDRDIAMVFQNYALYPHMSVRKNLAFGLKLRGYPKGKIDERVDEAARILEIGKLLDRKPKALSGGQRQRVAVGRAIVRKPKAFLFDEPLSNLDAKLRVQMRAEISKLHRELKTTMIYVTHDQTEAMTMGDRIVVLKDGIIHQVGNPIELYLHPGDRFVAGFIGSPPMNFVEGELAEESGGTRFVAEGLNLPVAGEHLPALRKLSDRKVTLGIRAEDIHLLTAANNRLRPAAFTALLELAEPMGAEVFIYLRFDEARLVARVSPRDRVEAGRNLEMAMDMSKAHYFHPETGKTIV